MNKKLNLFALMLIVGLGFQVSAQAFSMKCKTVCSPRYEQGCWRDGTTHDAGFGMHILVFGAEEGIECKTNKGKSVLVELTGVGPGMRVDWQNSFRIVCPTIPHSRLEKKLAKQRAMRLYGPEVAAGLRLGGKLGIYGNLTGGVCFMAGVGNSAGASATISELKIIGIKD